MTGGDKEFNLKITRWAGAVSQVIRPVLELIWPQKPLMASPKLHSSQWHRVQHPHLLALEPPFCRGCFAPIDPGLMFELCLRCKAPDPDLDAVRSAFVYDEVSRDLILTLKYGDAPELADRLWPMLWRISKDLPVSAVLPIPLHFQRQWQRRYNQAAELARPLARHLDLPFRPQWLVRHRATPAQGHRSHRARHQNLAGAFRVPTTFLPKVHGEALLLVDDVVTSGASFRAAARALKAAGAKSVHGVALAYAGQRPVQDLAMLKDEPLSGGGLEL